MKEDLWLRLYQAENYDGLQNLLLEHAHGVRRLVVRVNQLGRLIPGWTEVAELHLKGYRDFVHHWITDALTEDDWERAMQWVASKKKGGASGQGQNPFQWLSAKGQSQPFTLERWLIDQLKANPYMPFEESYRQVLNLIVLESAGQLRFRPRFCSACGVLFVPSRNAQRWCTARCRYRIFQRQYRAKRNSGRLAGLSVDESGKNAPGMSQHKAGPRSKSIG